MRAKPAKTEKMVEIPKWAVRRPDGVIIRLYVQPNASRSEVSGEHGEGEAVRLKIRIAAPPVDSAANEELVYFLKKSIGVPASRIHLIRGATSRSKDVFLEGTSLEEAVEKLMRR